MRAGRVVVVWCVLWVVSVVLIGGLAAAVYTLAQMATEAAK